MEKNNSQPLVSMSTAFSFSNEILVPCTTAWTQSSLSWSPLELIHPISKRVLCAWAMFHWRFTVTLLLSREQSAYFDHTAQLTIHADKSEVLLFLWRQIPDNFCTINVRGSWGIKVSLTFWSLTWKIARQVKSSWSHPSLNRRFSKLRELQLQSSLFLSFHLTEIELMSDYSVPIVCSTIYTTSQNLR